MRFRLIGLTSCMVDEIIVFCLAIRIATIKEFGFLDLTSSVTNADVIVFQVHDTCSTSLRFFFWSQLGVWFFWLSSFLKDVNRSSQTFPVSARNHRLKNRRYFLENSHLKSLSHYFFQTFKYPEKNKFQMRFSFHRFEK